MKGNESELTRNRRVGSTRVCITVSIAVSLGGIAVRCGKVSMRLWMVGLTPEKVGEADLTMGGIGRITYSSPVLQTNGCCVVSSGHRSGSLNCVVCSSDAAVSKT